MTEEEQKALVALLSQQINAGANPLLMASAYPYNVSPSGVTSSFNPEILFASGAVSPENVARGQESVYQQMLADYLAKSRGNVSFEASQAFLNNAMGRYATGNDPVSEFIRQATNQLVSGNVTVDQILTQAQKDAKSLPKEIVDNWGNVSAAITDLGKKVETYRTAQAKDAYNAQGVSIPMPTMDQARAQYFKDMGVPQFAALPDPTQGFAVSPETFIADRAKYDALNNALRLEAEKRNKARYTPTAQEAIRLGKEAEIYARKANEEVARQRAKEIVSGMQTDMDWKDYLKAHANIAAGVGTGAAVGSVVPVIGTGVGAALGGLAGLASVVTGGDKLRKERERKKAAAEQLHYMIQLAKMDKVTPASDEASRLKYDPSYRAQVAAEEAARGRVSQEEAYARMVADAFNARLSERGITPYSQAMNQILSYAMATGKK